MENEKEPTMLEQSKSLTEQRFKSFEDGYNELVQRTGIRITAKVITSENGVTQIKYESSMIPGWGV